MDLKTTLIDLQCEMVAERTAVSPQAISWLQYDILYQLDQGGKMLPSNLSVILGTSRTKLSKALKGLKVMGYIRQLPNQLDGRELYTSITEEGQTLLTAISGKHTALYHTAVQSLTEEEQAIFAKLSHKVSLGLRRERIANGE